MAAEQQHLGEILHKINAHVDFIIDFTETEDVDEETDRRIYDILERIRVAINSIDDILSGR